MSSPRSVIIGQGDLDRVEALIRSNKNEDYELLADELDAATVVPSKEVPAGVVTMGSKISFLDLDTDQTSTMRLAYPKDMADDPNSVSILAPVGAALIGLRVGETIEWPLPNKGKRRLKVVAVEARE